MRETKGQSTKIDEKKAKDNQRKVDEKARVTVTTTPPPSSQQWKAMRNQGTIEVAPSTKTDKKSRVTI